MVRTKRALMSLVAVVVTMPLLSCSFNLGKWDSDPADKQLQPNAKDDAACQQAGNTYGSPEYQQCLQNLAQQRANSERAESRPMYPLGR
jgi:hypothetical protein